MSAECCRPQWRNLDYYNLEESTPPYSPWLPPVVASDPSRKRKCTELKTWSKRRMGPEVVRGGSTQRLSSNNNLTLKKTPWTRINDLRKTMSEIDNSEAIETRPEYHLSDAGSSQLSTDSGYCSSKDGENDSRDSSIAPTTEHSPSPFSSIDDEVEDLRCNLVSEVASIVPQYPRSLEFDQWSPQSSEDEYHESHFPANPDFDSYFEKLLDPQLNGAPDAESWPDDLTPDWLLDTSFNLLRPFKRPFAQGRGEDTTRNLGNHYFAQPKIQSTLGNTGNLFPSYEYQNFALFGESKHYGCGPFPLFGGPDFSSANTEYGNFVVRDSYSRRENPQKRRMIWHYPGQNKLQGDEMLTAAKGCCNSGRIISTCTSCSGEPARLASCKQCLGVGHLWKPCRQCYIGKNETQSSTWDVDNNHELDGKVPKSRGDVGCSTIGVSQASSTSIRPVENNMATPVLQSTAFPTLGDSHTTPSSPNILASEEDLEVRVFSVLGSDTGLARAVVDRLKDHFPFISPLFRGVDEGSVLGDSPQYSSPMYEHGSSGSPSATSSASQTKSSSTSSGMTPATSISSEKFGGGEDGDDKDSPSKDLPRKRQKISTLKQPKTAGRRRLRCHFHAKCPITHNQKACAMSGWLSIHNLRGHYSSHHTKIRCNRCFGEFERKTEKNVHQRSCSVNAPSPSFEVIDCDKLDELEECLGIFRSWQLETEDDQTMRQWILKYKPELSSNSTDDAYNSRELAKWYRIWQTLYPTLQFPVPSPFHDESISPANLKVERILTVFQSLAEAEFEQSQLPPVDLTEQVEYYKDILRNVFRVIQSSPGSSPASSFGSSNQSESQFAATPAYTMTNATPAASHTPMPGQFHDLEPGLAATPSRTSSSIPATIQPSALSPYAIETSGAVGQSPNLRKSQSKPLSLENIPSSAQNSSSPTDRISMPSLGESPLISTRTLSQMGGHSAMGPPPRRNAGSVQSNYPSPLDYSQEALPSEFMTGESRYSNNEENQRNCIWKSWTNAEVAGNQEFFCSVCSSSGLVDLGEGAQQCFSCNPPFEIGA